MLNRIPHTRRFLFIWLMPLLLVSLAAAQSPIPSGAKLEKIAVGIQQSEGSDLD